MKMKLANSAPRIVHATLFALALAQTLPSISLAQAGSQGNSLAEAYQIISSKQFVDLTHSFSPLTPVWKGFGPASFSAAADPETGAALHDREGWLSSVLLLDGWAVRYAHRPARAL